MFQRILVVCVGNICRSPIAEVMLQQCLPSATVASAGLLAEDGRPMAAAARAVLEAHGFPAGEHAARQLDVGVLHAADLVLVMERAHVQVIARQAPQALGRMFLLGHWQGGQEIPDPYGEQRPAFEQAYRLIAAGVDAWLPYLHDTVACGDAPRPAVNRR